MSQAEATHVPLLSEGEYSGVRHADLPRIYFLKRRLLDIIEEDRRSSYQSANTPLSNWQRETETRLAAILE